MGYLSIVFALMGVGFSILKAAGQSDAGPAAIMFIFFTAIVFGAAQFIIELKMTSASVQANAAAKAYYDKASRKL